MEPCFSTSCVSHITHCEHQCRTIFHTSIVSCPLKKVSSPAGAPFFWHKVLLEFGASFRRSTKVVAVLSSLESWKIQRMKHQKIPQPTTWVKWTLQKWSSFLQFSPFVFHIPLALNKVKELVKHTGPQWLHHTLMAVCGASGLVDDHTMTWGWSKQLLRVTLSTPKRRLVPQGYIYTKNYPNMHIYIYIHMDIYNIYIYIMDTVLYIIYCIVYSYSHSTTTSFHPPELLFVAKTFPCLCSVIFRLGFHTPKKRNVRIHKPKLQGWATMIEQLHFQLAKTGGEKQLPLNARMSRYPR